MGTHVFLEPIGASTILNVYGWIANNFLSLLVDLGLNTSLEAGVLMNAKSYHKKGLFNIEKQTIDINHELMTQKKFCDNIFDIISVLTHERQHLLDAVLFGLKVYESWGGEEFQEWHAYTTQVIYNPYWIFTTPVFQVHIMNTYGQYIDNIIKGMGGK